MPLLEIACFQEQSARNAEACGADRVELCKDQSLGGTTPLLSTFQALKKDVSIPIYVMIRPHGHDFVYTEDELKAMERDVQIFKGESADGFVFGILTTDAKVDREKCSRLVKSADGRPCTYHRAFDEMAANDMEEQLEVLINCGFRAILTSGGKKNALEGKEVLKKLVQAAKGRIDIIAGGGVRSGNLEVLKAETGADVFHSSAIVETSHGETADVEEIKRLSMIANR